MIHCHNAPPAAFYCQIGRPFVSVCEHLIIILTANKLSVQNLVSTGVYVT